MPLFECSKCGSIENTVLGCYWNNRKKPLCSECCHGKWHGKFKKESAKNMIKGKDGFLYYSDEKTP